MKYFSYLNTAVEITSLYSGQQPFHLFLKEFFRQHKKYGSTDRKQIAHLCYCYFRLGTSLQHIPVSEKILCGVFLCTHQNNAVLGHFKPAWNEHVHAGLQEKCAFIQIAAEALQIFPCPGEVSNKIVQRDFELSHLVQPDLFLRIRPGYRQTVINKLEQAQLAFSLTHENCVGLPNATKIDAVVEINREAVIQDYSSQRTGHFLEPVKVIGPVIKVWDCCAASGGKSIMAKDILSNIELTVSDIRPAVLINLKKRFAEAGIHPYKTYITDLSAPVVNLLSENFELVIADVPCSGSGTWGRTPERLSFFDKKEIDRYADLQKKIVTAVIPAVKSGGYFLYITCSVFEKENEEMADFIQENFSAMLVQQEVLKGYSIRADTLFAALFQINR